MKSPRRRPPVASESLRAAIYSSAEADHQSVILLIQELVKISSRSGLDSYDKIINQISHWLEEYDLPPRQLLDEDVRHSVALVCDINGEQPGPHYVLNACLDTAPFGDVTSWRHPPTSGAIEAGWLYGRGAADSKAAISIFMHIARQLRAHTGQIHGTATLLFDADEHTGRFGGARRYFSGNDATRDIDGVMIGYPGMDKLVIGGRGFLRARVTVRGQAGHTGSQRAENNINAVEKAVELVGTLSTHRIPGSIDSNLDLPPKLTVTGISGGESFSIIPDICTINIDIRLTTSFDENDAKALIEDSIRMVDERWPLPEKTTTVEFYESWPAYRLAEKAPIRVALARAAEHYLGNEVSAKVAGPSNIGNYLAKLGIDATAGFGVNYEGLHGTDERIELATIPTIQAIYHEAILTLLSP